MGKRAKSTIGLDKNVYIALADYVDATGGQIKGYASIAIAKWLREQGVDIEYPVKRQAEPTTQRRRSPKKQQAAA